MYLEDVAEASLDLSRCNFISYCSPTFFHQLELVPLLSPRFVASDLAAVDSLHRVPEALDAVEVRPVADVVEEVDPVLSSILSDIISSVD